LLEEETKTEKWEKALQCVIPVRILEINERPENRKYEHPNCLTGPFKTNVIHLKERDLNMLKKDLILRNPLRLISTEEENFFNNGGFGAVLARAGVGKTSLIVQIALNSLLMNKRVLHISLNDPIDKVSLWYQEVFNLLAKQYNILQMNDLWESVIHNRFIMTFKVEGFSAPKLEERLTDLTEQGIFTPDMMIIDGLPFNETVIPHLEELKNLAIKNALHVWFTIKTHRHDDKNDKGIPERFLAVRDMFDAAIQLRPKTDEIQIRAIKGKKEPDLDADLDLLLDPSTMLIKDKKELK